MVAADNLLPPVFSPIVIQWVMPRKRVPITEEQWKEAADHYELGLASARALAARLGVSPATFSRQMKRRGAKKASRVEETVADLKDVLDRRARHRAKLSRAAEDAAWKRSAAIDEAIGRMVRALVEASNNNDWNAANIEIDRAGRVVGTKPRR